MILDTRPPRSQQRDKTVYQHLCRSLLILCSSPCHTRRPKLPTALSISQFTRRDCAIHIPRYRSTAAISRNAPSLLLQSTAVHQAIILHPSRGAPNDVDVLSRSRRIILLCSRYDCSCRQIRFRLISPIPSLLNHRGNDLHTVDVNTTWYVHREGVPQPQRQGNN